MLNHKYYKYTFKLQNCKNEFNKVLYKKKLKFYENKLNMFQYGGAYDDETIRKYFSGIKEINHGDNEVMYEEFLKCLNKEDFKNTILQNFDINKLQYLGSEENYYFHYDEKYIFEFVTEDLFWSIDLITKLSLTNPDEEHKFKEYDGYKYKNTDFIKLHKNSAKNITYNVLKSGDGILGFLNEVPFLYEIKPELNSKNISKDYDEGFGDVKNKKFLNQNNYDIDSFDCYYSNTYENYDISIGYCKNKSGQKFSCIIIAKSNEIISFLFSTNDHIFNIFATESFKFTILKNQKKVILEHYRSPHLATVITFN